MTLHTILPYIAFTWACCVEMNEDRPILSTAKR